MIGPVVHRRPVGRLEDEVVLGVEGADDQSARADRSRVEGTAAGGNAERQRRGQRESNEPVPCRVGPAVSLRLERERPVAPTLATRMKYRSGLEIVEGPVSSSLTVDGSRRDQPRDRLTADAVRSPRAWKQLAPVGGRAHHLNE